MKDKKVDRLIKLKDKHNNIYEYPNFEYNGFNVKIDILCKEHGLFYQRYDRHLLGAGCPVCGAISCAENRKNNLINKKFKDLIQPSEFKLIPLSKGMLAKVDNEDFEELSKHNWNTTHYGYSFNRILGLMHRYIMKTPEGMDTDHINHDKLDNRKSNLRICNRTKNNANRLLGKNQKSKYKGVSFNSMYRKWHSYISFNKKRQTIGYFDNEIDAAKSYDKKAKELFGEFAYLNNV